MEMDGRPHRSSEDILDLEGIDYEEDSEAEKVSLMHEGKRRASYSRHDKAPANHDRLLGGNLPSRLAEGKLSSEGKVEEGEGPEQNDNWDTGSDMQKGSGCNPEKRSEGHCGSQLNGLVTNCKCEVENEGCSHRHCDNSQELTDSIGDCDDPDNCCYGDRNDDVTCKELGFERHACCHDNHNSLGHVLGCVNHCGYDVCEAEKSKNNNLVPGDISLASESMTDWEPVETSCNRGNDDPPLVSNKVLIGTDCHGNLSKTLPIDMVDNSSGYND